MATTGHTVKAFDDDLGQLRGLVAEMGGRAEAAISDAMQALVRRDLDAAARIVDEDRKIDAIEAEIERQALRLIALRAPMADDLRDVLCRAEDIGRDRADGRLRQEHRQARGRAGRGTRY